MEGDHKFAIDVKRRVHYFYPRPHMEGDLTQRHK